MCLSAKVVTSTEHPTLSGPGLSNPTLTSPASRKPAVPLNTDKIITKKQLQEQLKVISYIPELALLVRGQMVNNKIPLDLSVNAKLGPGIISSDPY